PFDKQTDTIIGNISGVRPTATASEKKNASFQSCFVNALITNTSGTITAIKRIINHVKRRTPRSNAVSICGPQRLLATLPKYVCAPVDKITAIADPLSMLVPRKQRLVRSIGETFSRGSRASVFSTGSDSPVNVAWMIKRSLAE